MLKGNKKNYLPEPNMHFLGHQSICPPQDLCFIPRQMPLHRSTLYTLPCLYNISNCWYWRFCQSEIAGKSAWIRHIFSGQLFDKTFRFITSNVISNFLTNQLEFPSNITINLFFCGSMTEQGSLSWAVKGGVCPLKYPTRPPLLCYGPTKKKD